MAERVWLVGESCFHPTNRKIGICLKGLLVKPSHSFGFKYQNSCCFVYFLRSFLAYQCLSLQFSWLCSAIGRGHMFFRLRQTFPTVGRSITPILSLHSPNSAIPQSFFNKFYIWRTSVCLYSSFSISFTSAMSPLSNVSA